MDELLFSLDIDGLNEPADTLEFPNIDLTADFGKSQPQAVLGIDQLTFLNKSADFIIQHYNNGDILQRIGLTLTIQSNNDIVTLPLLIDLSKNFLIIDETKVRCAIISDKNIQDFEDKIRVLTFDFFDQTLVFPSYDVSVAVVRVNQQLEIFMAGMMIVMMTIELVRTAQNLGQQIASFVSALASGAFGSLSAAIYAVAMLLFNVALFAGMVLAYSKMVSEFIRLVLPIPTTRKYIKPIEILEVVFKELGYNSIQTTNDIKSISYLSSFKDNYNTGLPNDLDNEIRVSEMLLFVLKESNSLVKIDKNNNVLIYPEGHEIWMSSSSYVMPDVLDEKESPNIEDLTPVKIIQYQGDVNNEYTRINYKGTSFKILTQSTIENETTAIPKGLNDIFLGVQICNSKTELTGLEEAVNPLLEAFNQFSSFLGLSDVLSFDFNKTIGCIKVSDEIWGVPIVWKGNTTNNGQHFVLPSGFRDRTAKEIYLKDYAYRSFVVDGKKGQFINKANDNLPMTLGDYVSLLDNPLFTNINGDECTALKINYSPSLSLAKIEYYISKTYTNKLKETYVEQE